MRLESDTYSQLSHRAPLYIDPYYQGQIALALAICLGGKERNNRELEVSQTIAPLTARWVRWKIVVLTIKGELMYARVHVCVCVYQNAKCCWGTTGQRWTQTTQL